MKPLPEAGWFTDPDRRHEARYWDGARWTDHVGDLGATSQGRLRSRAASAPGRAEREQRRAWWCFGGTVVAVVLSGIWTMVVGTSSPGGDDSELIGGWAGVVRNLPGYVVAVGVASLAVWFAARSVRHGAHGGRSVLIASSLMLLFALNAVTRDAAEVVMTTRAATVTWVLFAVDVCLVAIVYVAARRWSRSGQSSRVADQTDASRPAPGSNPISRASGR